MAQKSTRSPYHIALFSAKEWGVVLALALVVLGVRVWLEYRSYENLPFDEPAEIRARVLSQYQKVKNDKPYWVLKLASHSHTFYTTSKEDLKNLQGRSVRVYGKINSQKDCSFLQYFRSCFFVGFSISTLPSLESNALDSRLHALRESLRGNIMHQHGNSEHNNSDRVNNDHGGLFSALFLATPLPASWRDVSNTLGLAHIFAISGFHLGIISFVLLALLTPPYRALQRRYFSYRNQAYDLGMLVLLTLALYLVVLDFAPSFLRAFVMALVGFVLYYCGLELLSFSLLGLCALLCVVAFPSVLLNRGFILSVAGVFYIFIILRYMGDFLQSLRESAPESNRESSKESKTESKAHLLVDSGLDSATREKRIRALVWRALRAVFFVLWFHIAIFLLIMPVVHVFFPYFSPWQLVSIPVSMGFIVLFPLAALLHGLGLGGVGDVWLDFVLGLEIARVDITTPWWFLCTYLVASAWAMISRAGYYALLVCAIGFYGACWWAYSTS